MSRSTGALSQASQPARTRASLLQEQQALIDQGATLKLYLSTRLDDVAARAELQRINQRLKEIAAQLSEYTGAPPGFAALAAAMEELSAAIAKNDLPLTIGQEAQDRGLLQEIANWEQFSIDHPSDAPLANLQTTELVSKLSPGARFEREAKQRSNRYAFSRAAPPSASAPASMMTSHDSSLSSGAASASDSVISASSISSRWTGRSQSFSSQRGIREITEDHWRAKMAGNKELAAKFLAEKEAWEQAKAREAFTEGRTSSAPAGSLSMGSTPPAASLTLGRFQANPMASASAPLSHSSFIGSTASSLLALSASAESSSRFPPLSASAPLSLVSALDAIKRPNNEMKAVGPRNAEEKLSDEDWLRLFGDSRQHLTKEKAADLQVLLADINIPHCGKGDKNLPLYRAALAEVNEFLGVATQASVRELNRPSERVLARRNLFALSPLPETPEAQQFPLGRLANPVLSPAISSSAPAATSSPVASSSSFSASALASRSMSH